VNWGRFHQQVYGQLLRAQIPKEQKDSQTISVFSRFRDLFAKKQLYKIGEIDTSVQI